MAKTLQNDLTVKLTLTYNDFGKKSRPDPHFVPTGNVGGLGIAAAILTPGEDCDLSYPLLPRMLGSFHNESFHAVFPTRRLSLNDAFLL